MVRGSIGVVWGRSMADIVQLRGLRGEIPGCLGYNLSEKLSDQGRTPVAAATLPCVGAYDLETEPTACIWC